MTIPATVAGCSCPTVPRTRSLTAAAGVRLLVFSVISLLPANVRAQTQCIPLPPGATTGRTAATNDSLLALDIGNCDATAPAERGHVRGGWHLAVVFGDSADHLRHNAIAVGALSTGLIAFLWTLPEDLPRFYTRDPTFSQFSEAFTKPPLWSDGDWWFWNWVAHPYVGMQEYLMERNWGSSPLRSFLFSTAASLAWEYGFESWMERPSLQDILLTSPAGILLGEGAFQLTQQLRRNGLSLPEKLVVVVLNPFYVLQHGFR